MFENAHLLLECIKKIHPGIWTASGHLTIKWLKTTQP